MKYPPEIKISCFRNLRAASGGDFGRGSWYAALILFGSFFGTACSPVVSDWAPVQVEPYSITVLAPATNFSTTSDFKYPALLMKAVSAVSAQAAENSARNEQSSVQIEWMDWVQHRNKINEVWEIVDAEYKQRRGYFDAVSLADALSPYELFANNRVLVIRITSQSTEQIEIATIDGFRMMETNSAGIEVNRFAVSFVINPDTVITVLSRIISKLLNGMAYSAPSLDKMGFIPLAAGCAAIGKSRDETCFDPFYLSKYLVTQSQWEFVMKAHKIPKKGGRYPVVNIRRDEIPVFLEKLNDKTGKSFRLPTAKEWEYACQNGNARMAYGTIDGKIDNDRGNFSGVQGKDRWAGRSPVGSFPPSPSGLHDMSGNVWEWTENRYWDPDKNIFFAFLDNLGTVDRYVVKGGSFDETAERLACGAHQVLSEKSQSGDVGFRLLLEE